MNEKEQVAANWEAVDRFMRYARIDIARGHYIKANAIGLVSASEYIQEHKLVVEEWVEK